MPKHSIDNPDVKTGRNSTEERPPLFSSWKAWYALLLLHLASLIVLFYLFTKAFE